MLYNYWRWILFSSAKELAALSFQQRKGVLQSALMEPQHKQTPLQAVVPVTCKEAGTLVKVQKQQQHKKAAEWVSVAEACATAWDQ